MENPMQIQIDSEFGELEGVILHTPGPEIENMTPENAERALYSDILNLSVAKEEYSQLQGVLNTATKVFQVKDLLSDILAIDRVKEELIEKICRQEGNGEVKFRLISISEIELARQLIEGVVMNKDNLTKFLCKERYDLKPLHNFFFTRDASMAFGKQVIIGSMANKVRERESIIMRSIFENHPVFSTRTLAPTSSENSACNLNIEGGDFLAVRKDVVLLGLGMRTNSQAVDFLIEHFRKRKQPMTILIQELPLKGESFIHLDMVFTLLGKSHCMIYEPVILKHNRFRTISIKVEGQSVLFTEEENLLSAMKKLGLEFEPVYCGGNKDEWIQEREQWHCGANFFSICPGKIIGYGRNIYTMEALNEKGFEIIQAKEIINRTKKLEDYSLCAVSIEGSELSRGGGGCRCMTMPLRRKEI